MFVWEKGGWFVSVLGIAECLDGGKRTCRLKWIAKE